MELSQAELMARIAVLESQHQGLTRDIASLHTTDEKINAKLDMLIEAHTKYKGAVGLVTLLGSVLFSLATLTVATLKGWILK